MSKDLSDSNELILTMFQCGHLQWTKPEQQRTLSYVHCALSKITENTKESDTI